MNFFTAQKHASFAAKLFTAAGFDFEKALAANDAEALKAHLATKAPEPVAALFDHAGLDLDTLLAAGPESLKAHLASLDNAEQLNTLIGDLASAKSALDAKSADITALKGSVEAATNIFNIIGLSDTVSADADSGAIKTAFADHVSKQVTLAQAKAGHPPVHQIDANASPAAIAGEAHLKAYEALPRGPEKTAYFAQHESAIWAAACARTRGE